jgi:hypothetical protein
MMTQKRHYFSPSFLNIQTTKIQLPRDLSCGLIFLNGVFVMVILLKQYRGTILLIQFLHLRGHCR